MARVNPFRPHYPVNPGMFVGRLEEIERIERHLLQTRARQPANFLITGERGIGKTSLLNYVKWAAKGDIPLDDETLRFLVVDTDIEPGTTQLGLIRKVELGLREQLAQTEKARTFLSDAWQFLRRVEAGGFRLGSEDREDETLFDEFCYTLARIADRICSDKDDAFSARYEAILLLVDEADNSGKTLQLGLFLKLLLERLHRRGCANVMVGLAGLDTLPRVLSASHPSALRMFDILTLNRLSTGEVSQVIDICLHTANQENEDQVAITEDARAFLISLSEGYPHFIQQFGYSAFEQDTDGSIDQHDVGRGAFGENGALELIGDRYYRDDFFNRIQKESYRQVLRIMADRLDGWVTKTEIRDRFKGTDPVLSNALKALRDRHIILPKQGEKGVYRLQHKGFALWIRAYTTDPTELQKSFDSARTVANGSPPAPEGTASA